MYLINDKMNSILLKNEPEKTVWNYFFEEEPEISARLIAKKVFKQTSCSIVSKERTLFQYKVKSLYVLM